MSLQPSVDPGLVSAHTTAAPSSVIHWAKQHYGLNVQQSHLIRRGLNDNYALLGSDGARYVARLCSIRSRGEFNIEFETSLIEHLAAKGVGVAAPLRTLDGACHARLQFPEGSRALAIFHHADGVVPETLDEFELTGYTLARIHLASRDYAGPASRYTLNSRHLVGRTWTYLQAYPSLDAGLLDAYQQRIQALQQELARVESGLTQVSDARKTIDSSIEAVHRVAALVAEISDASVEQGLAIDRVAHLIVEIDHATQQNVPMAEGAAQSARALEEQGRDLLRTASVFRLS